MKNISPFQLIIMIVCGVAAVFALLIFSGKLPIGQQAAKKIQGNITIWGTLPYSAMNLAMGSVSGTYENVRINYEEKNRSTFQSDLVNALASGTGPDLVLINQTDIVTNEDRFFVTPFTSLPEQTYRSLFVDQASSYITPTGVIAFPLVIDPMVMFYNRDMLTSAFSVAIPKTWSDIIGLIPRITQKDDGGILQTQTVALGTFDNISYPKEIISLLGFQTGNPIVQFDVAQQSYISTVKFPSASTAYPIADAFDFFTSFSNPLNQDRYSWNTSLPKDQNQFIAGKLAIYFGYASEIDTIRKKNPNLNFGIDMMPQRTGSPTKITYGSMTGIAIMKMSKNPTLALMIAQLIADKKSVQAILDTYPRLAPARRDMLSGKESDALSSVIYNSAIISRGFLDPDTVQTNTWFKKYITDISSGIGTGASLLESKDATLSGILSQVQRK